MFFLKVRPKKHLKLDKRGKKEIAEIVERELTPYLKREDLQGELRGRIVGKELQEYLIEKEWQRHLSEIANDKNKKKLWNSISSWKKKQLKEMFKKKIRVKYVLEKKEASHDKK